MTLRNDEFRTALELLHHFCHARGWRGYDPYDGLNSRLFCATPFAKNRRLRQIWIQVHRRSPVNLRRLCGIVATANAKGLALFALGSRDALLLEELRGLELPGGGWGYPFSWQSRAFYAPAGTPNLICTAFVARAFRALGESCDVNIVENRLLREANGERWITYIPESDTQVHNVNLIGAALLGRRDCIEFSARRQQPDGSWLYGEAPNQRWIDNFHTGFCLVALKDYQEAAGDDEFALNIERGFAYWDRVFWEPDGAPRYYHDRAWPRDIHCSAQGVLTYLRFGRLEAAERVARWALRRMWDPRGFFWYQRHRWWTNRICYLRWSQAWMYYALAELIRAHDGGRESCG